MTPAVPGFEGLPSELTELNQWLLWRYQSRGTSEKQTKVPYSTAGTPASTTDQSTWSTFEEASRVCQLGKYSGLGFVFSEDNGLCGIDLDDCLTDTGYLKAWAAAIIRDISNTYMEVSPSGLGVKIWCRARLASTGKRWKVDEVGRRVAPDSLDQDGEIEVYDRGRYFTVTGNRFNEAPLHVADAQAAVDRLLLREAVPMQRLSSACRASSFTDKVPVGNRHTALLSVAGEMRNKGADAAEIQAALDIMNTTRLAEPKSPDEIAGIVKWICSKQPSEPTKERPGSNHNTPEWPAAMAGPAFHGLVGEVVRMMEPHTEADPAAILVQFLVSFGSLIGRSPFWQVESTRHYSNLFVTIVGATSKGRKGTSLDNTMSVFQDLDTQWAKGRVTSGLSTGEGLIWAVRDAVIENVAIKEKGRIARYEMMETDPGITDKRLLVIEPEFARVLSVSERDGNTLSPVLRNAWDCKMLNILTKRQAGKCGEPHISIIAHITKDELLRLLSDTAMANGFANRFLFVCARRSKCLPFGGEWSRLNWAPVIMRLDRVIDLARDTSLVSLSSPGREMWGQVYPGLSEGRPGMLGAVTGRAEAQVLRLAMLYALLDGSCEIDAQHLEAALEVWRYCEDTCKFIFGDSLGDPTADEINRALKQRPEGMTRKEISDLFSRHKASGDIQRSLGVLQRLGMARVEIEKTDGRPAERWYKQ